VSRLGDATRLAAVLLAAPLSRRVIRPLGEEAVRPLPGDELIPEAKGRWTHGITISARPAEIWPWLVQMGCRRAGWYCYDGLDNGGAPSATRILPELQQVAVGDLFPWTPTAEDGFFCEALEPDRALVIGGSGDPRSRVSWAFVLEPLEEGTTRLITRASFDYQGRGLGLMLKTAIRPVDFGMQRRQLLSLRQRAEAGSP
jgi:hypothetical protein